MKIYTRTGDDGTTGLIGGDRVSKSNARIDCFGQIDELNAALGLAAVSGSAEMVMLLRAIQSDLFVIGSHIACPDDKPPANLPAIEESGISRLEMEIDSATNQLPALRNFILPGGTELGARLHMARTICRRAERALVRFAEDRPVPAVILTYLNRLSDWLFVQARYANHAQGVDDVEWKLRAD